MKIRKILFIFFLNFLILDTVKALEPDIFVQSTVNRASKVLSENISKTDKIEKLKKIAIETVDIKGIGFYTLGPIRKTLKDDQKIEYSKIFNEYFLKSFSSRLAEYTKLIPKPMVKIKGKPIITYNKDKKITAA